MGFKENLRSIRKSLGLTQQDVADRLDKTREAVTRWESGATKPTADTLAALADALGVSTSDLMGDASTRASALPPGAIRPVAASATVPMLELGTIHAGDPIEAIEDATVVQIPEEVGGRHPRGFLLRVKGRCMDAAYPEGCRVLVDPDMAARPGSAVAVRLDGGDVVMRRYYRGSDTLMLVADSVSGEYEDIVFKGEMSEVELLGVICWFQAESDERD